MVNHVTLVGKVKAIKDTVVTLEIENQNEKKVDYIPIYLDRHLIEAAFDHINIDDIIGIRGYASEHSDQVFINAVRLSFIKKEDE